MVKSQRYPFENSFRKTMNKILIASSTLTVAAAQIAMTATASIAAIPLLNYTVKMWAAW
ncbi:MAG: hypothetical protein VKL41_19795 [Snowella sp.]|nr:hypothetical protein [Snowella sp.]